MLIGLSDLYEGCHHVDRRAHDDEPRTGVIPEPPLARWLFSSSRASWFWLIARLWLGWEWLRSGWSKVFGGNITVRVWEWSDQQYALTGDANIGWVRGVGDVGVGDAVAGFADRAIQASEGPHPDVAYGWYVAFLEWVRDTAHPWPVRSWPSASW